MIAKSARNFILYGRRDVPARGDAVRKDDVYFAEEHAEFNFVQQKLGIATAFPLQSVLQCAPTVERFEVAHGLAVPPSRIQRISLAIVYACF